MATHVYQEPVSSLLTYGKLGDRGLSQQWPDYLALGFGDEHVSDLIRMATDAELNASNGESVEVWAPLHAWRALGQLSAEDAVEPLVRLFDAFEYDDWIPSELPRVFAMIGPVAIPTLAAYLDDENVDEMYRISVPVCFEKIAKRHPSAYDDCVAVLVEQLRHYRTNGATLNAFIICALVDLRATHTIDDIRKVFLEDLVDELVMGDVEDVEIEMRLRTFRSSPRKRSDFFGLPSDFGGRYAGNGPVRHGPKVGRNEPCPCGSGKKFKKCCLNLSVRLD